MNILYNFSPADQSRPSFFELLIETQMLPSLKPAFKYTLLVLSQRLQGLTWCAKWSDELFYGILLLLERHYLKHYDGSFSENFYGLKRSPVSSDPEKETLPLSPNQKRLCLFFLVGVPYIKDKLDKVYANKFSRNRSTHPETGLKQILWKIFQITYPIFTAIYEGLFFTYQLLYMYNYSTYYTPFLHLQSLTIKRLTINDMRQQERKQISQKRKRQRQSTGIVDDLYGYLIDGTNTLFDYSKYVLPGAIFFFKFLEWWYTENRLTSPQLPIPPPPEPPKVALGGIEVPTDRSLCPICRKKRVGSAISSSGFVFCYSCIYKHVSDFGCCPVTRVPCSAEQIRRIFDDQN